LSFLFHCLCCSFGSPSSLQLIAVFLCTSTRVMPTIFSQDGSVPVEVAVILCVLLPAYSMSYIESIKSQVHLGCAIVNKSTPPLSYNVDHAHKSCIASVDFDTWMIKVYILSSHILTLCLLKPNTYRISLSYL
jgi:hypothetical protein